MRSPRENASVLLGESNQTKYETRNTNVGAHVPNFETLPTNTHARCVENEAHGEIHVTSFLEQGVSQAMFIV